MECHNRLVRLVGLLGLLLAPTFPQAATEQTLLVIGDSLSSGYHMESSRSWPALLERRLHESGRAIRVINASRKGDTSNVGRDRLPGALNQYRPDWVIIELGANDGLRGQSLEQLRRNLGEMVALSRASGATPILVGTRLPPDVDPEYARRYSSVFVSAARDTGSALVPSLMETVIDHPDLFLWDHLHPSAEAQPRLLDVVWPVLDAALPRQ